MPSLSVARAASAPGESFSSTRRRRSSTRPRIARASRRRDWPAGIHRHPIDLIPLDAARELLLQRTAQDRRREPDDEAQALRLAELLDGLPLALEQAAAYTAHTQISLAEYLVVWESECDSVLGWYDEAVMQYPAPLAVTWQRTFRQLAPTAQALLRLAAHLAPDPIPVASGASSSTLRFMSSTKVRWGRKRGVPKRMASSSISVWSSASSAAAGSSQMEWKPFTARPARARRRAGSAPPRT